jgi:hypothetical protein
MDNTKESSFVHGLTLGWLFAIACFSCVVLTQNVWSDASLLRSQHESAEMIKLRKQVNDLSLQLSAVSSKPALSMVASAK